MGADRRHRIDVLLIGLLIVGMVAAVVVGLADDADEDEDDTLRMSPRNDSGMVFDDTTEVVLLINAGHAGVVAVDLDRRVAAQSTIHGLGVGGPHPMTRAGDSLVVGSGEIFVRPLDKPRSRYLGSATIHLPAAEGAAVWLVDYPGGRIGEGTPTYTLSDLAGNKLLDEDGVRPDVGLPVTGATSALVLETPEGLALWDAATASISQRHDRAPGAGFVADVATTSIAWCEGECQDLYVANSETHEARRVAGNAAGVEPRSARFSPDGSLIAFLEPSPEAEEARLVVINPSSGESHLVSESSMPSSSLLAWSREGTQLFAVARTPSGETRTRVARYDVATGTFEAAALPFGGVHGFLILTQAEGSTFFDRDKRSAEECLSQGDHTEPCTFAF